MTYLTLDETMRRAVELHKQAAVILKSNPQVAHKLIHQALPYYQSAHSADMDNPAIAFMLGTAYLQLGINGMAALLLEKAISVKPDFSEAYNNLGAAYRAEHKNDKAEAAYLRGLEIVPDEPDMYANLTALAVNEGRPAAGIPMGEKCLKLRPDHPQGRWNLALLYLEAGNYEQGFRLYDAGFDSGDRRVKPYHDLDVPIWDGSKGKRVVVWGEQGLGDEMLFAGFLPDMAKDCEVIFDCHPRLEGAWRRSLGHKLLGVHGTRKTDQTPWVTDYEGIDAKCAIGSIPQYYWRSRRSNVPYLFPDPVKVQEMKAFLSDVAKHEHKEGLPVVGIGWMGGAKKTRADLRSTGLDALRPLLDRPALWVSLQYTEQARAEVTALRADGDIHVYHFDHIVREFDYDATLALLASLDLTIAVNTTVVHACGAMDIPCWTLTPHGHAWRYGQKGTNMPWYKSVRQYHRGSSDKDWSPVVERVCRDFDMWRGV